MPPDAWWAADGLDHLRRLGWWVSLCIQAPEDEQARSLRAMLSAMANECAAGPPGATDVGDAENTDAASAAGSAPAGSAAGSEAA
eukprot:4138441-Alexandrium_andersonii.AAC.1